MLVFIIKRLGNAVLVMLSVALIAFLIFRLAGDPVELMVGSRPRRRIVPRCVSGWASMTACRRNICDLSKMRHRVISVFPIATASRCCR